MLLLVLHILGRETNVAQVTPKLDGDSGTEYLPSS